MSVNSSDWLYPWKQVMSYIWWKMVAQSLTQSDIDSIRISEKIRIILENKNNKKIFHKNDKLDSLSEVNIINKILNSK